MKFYIQTFGCQMNSADSEEMSGHFLQHGLVPTLNKEEADLLLLNTCTVRQHAEDKALSYIGRLKPWKKKKSGRKIIVTGCAAERLKNSLQKRFPFVDLVIGARSIEEFPRIVNSLFKEKNSAFDWFHESESSFKSGALRQSGKPFVLGDSQSTVFVTIMRGCNYSCSYCIVPQVRGREIYRPADQILQEIREKVSSEEKEVMLLGQTVNSYWDRRDRPEKKLFDFSDLICEVNEIANVRSIRFMSPHPHYMSGKLICALSECKKICREIHLPVQSGSNKILKMMKRNYTREEYIEIADQLKRAIPDLKLSTDFIVGFPGEEEEDFEQTLSLIDRIPFSLAYCFKYSPRAGTESALLKEEVALPLKEERISRLLKKVENKQTSLACSKK